MTRLTYSFSAYRRSMQISLVPLFVFVEGYKDRYVYDQIAQCECQRSEVSFNVVTAEEIGIGGGGKEVLLKFFDYLAAESSLISNFKGKTTISIFFLDKDVDDILNTRRSSQHIVYTRTYEFENYFLFMGRLAKQRRLQLQSTFSQYAPLLATMRLGDVVRQEAGKRGLRFVSSQKPVVLNRCQTTDSGGHLSTLGYVVP